MNTPIPFQGSSSTALLESFDLPVFLLSDVVSLSADFEGLLDRPVALPPGIIAPTPDFGDFLDRSVALPPGIIAPTLDFGDLLLNDLQDRVTLLPTRLDPITPDLRDFLEALGFRLVDLISLPPDFRDFLSEPLCLPPGLICSPSESGSIAAPLGLDGADIAAAVGVAYFSDDDDLVNAVQVLAGDSIRQAAAEARENYDLVGILLDNFELSSGIPLGGIGDHISNTTVVSDMFTGFDDSLILIQLLPLETL